MKLSTLILICLVASLACSTVAGSQSDATSTQSKAPTAPTTTPPKTAATHQAGVSTKASTSTRNPASNSTKRPPGTQQANATAKKIEALDYDAATKANNIPGFEAFLKKHPNSVSKPEITEKLNVLREDHDWSETLQQNTIADLKHFHELHPESRHLRVEKGALRVQGVSGPGHPEVENIIDGMTIHQGRYYSQLRVTVDEYPSFSQQLSPGDAEGLGIGETVFENSNNYMWVRPSVPSREVTLYKIYGSVGPADGKPDSDDYQLAIWEEDLHRGVLLKNQQ